MLLASWRRRLAFLFKLLYWRLAARVQQAGVGGKNGAHMKGGASVAGACAAWSMAEHGSMTEHDRAGGSAAHGSAGLCRAGQGRAGQSTLDCRKKGTALPERAATRRVEGKDVSSARVWANSRNFGQRGGNLQGVGKRNDALSCVVAISTIIHSAQLIVGKIKLQGRQTQ